MTHSSNITHIVMPSAARDLCDQGKARRYAQGANLLSFGRAQ